VTRQVVHAGNERAPGETWSYYNGHYFVAGATLARLRATTFEVALQRLLDDWQLTSTGFARPAGAVSGWVGADEQPNAPYPRGRRPSGGLWSTVEDLLTFGERGLADDNLVATVARRRTPVDNPMPSGQMQRPPARIPRGAAAQPAAGSGLRGLASQDEALPLIAGRVSDKQGPLPGEDLAAAIDAFAA
jgi:D-alanyl-D-alanine carboxypeptidase